MNYIPNNNYNHIRKEKEEEWKRGRIRRIRRKGRQGKGLTKRKGGGVEKRKDKEDKKEG